ncbi:MULTISPECIES: hypothetical protein [Klebsiella]|uniref:hypothetical protein n=1 Tax=Klebsiella TaxID=570 RepID=UPI000B956A91|nr:hypothetical protein [Klebsiella pneumoniae]MBK1919952.1 hypothetical protein [Klebsiella pneumoniae subsp. pneumoniae]MBL2712999.1 hypothetical protein [Klebsiella pneumoniae]MBL2741637.1 hypothetical protein [Klebsiella pneumoniae]MBL2774090.1 hypothetical protein [Klebsiella pneumoniae]MBS9473902.1 hypothetical protein [Klebsiella pneumoniae]
MIKIILICLSLSSCAALADDGSVSGEVAEKIQSEIQHAGYECERVDSVETQWFFGTTANVVCDSVFRFILEYERGGGSVRVVNF